MKMEIGQRSFAPEFLRVAIVEAQPNYPFSLVDDQRFVITGWFV